VGVAAIVFATPAYYRGRMLALYTMTNIRYSLATVLLLGGGALTAYLMTGRRAYRAAVAELEATQ
jgi:hypothetical protein